MLILDAAIVNIALPSIKADLAFSDSTLSWVFNAYVLTFAGFGLVSGRVGDLFGHRRVFLWGLIAFVLASLSCALAHSQTQLILARAVQGSTSAIVGATAFALIVNLFPEGAERTKAFAIYGFITNGGGTLGVLLGGVLTSTLNWHWIFLVNLPIGAAVYALCVILLKEVRDDPLRSGIPDILGAGTMTLSLVLMVQAIIGIERFGWLSVRTMLTLLMAGAFFLLFLAVEARVRAPLIPRNTFRRNLVVCSLVSALMPVSGPVSLFVSLYLQLVLGNNPLEVSFALLPWTLGAAAVSLGLSARIAIRFGTKRPMVISLLLVAIGALLLARIPTKADVLLDVLPGTLLVSMGSTIATNSVLIAATTGLLPTETGLVTGIVSTASLMAGTLWLAVLASTANVRTQVKSALGVRLLDALNSGYHAAFLLCAALVLLAAILSAAYLRSDAPEIS